MMSRVALLVAALATSICSVGQAFVTPNAIFFKGGGFSPRSARHGYGHGHGAFHMSTSTDLKELGLTPELERLTKVFRSCPNNKMRQMQLLHLAQMGDKLDPSLMTDENLSLIHI